MSKMTKKQRKNALLHKEIIMYSKDPWSVSASYRDHLDIRSIHAFILEYFDVRKKSMNYVPLKMKELEEKLEKDLFVHERKKYQAEVVQLRKEYERIQSDDEKQEYIESAKPLLEMYESSLPKTKVVTVSGKQAANPHSERLLKAIESYISMAKKYMKVYVSKITEFSTACVQCGANEYDETTEGTSVCKLCGTVNERLLDTNVINESDQYVRPNGYVDIINFEKALHCFQGKQKKTIPPELFDDLDKYFSSYSLPTGQEIRQRPFTKDGKKVGTSKSDMFHALEKTKHSEFYDDVNLICHLYWGWKLPDLKEFEERIRTDYQTIQQSFYDLTDKEKESSLNTQFRLFKHLQLVGYPCTFYDFKFSDTGDTIDYYEKTWRRMCEKTGFSYIPTF